MNKYIITDIALAGYNVYQFRPDLLESIKKFVNNNNFQNIYESDEYHLVKQPQTHWKIVSVGEETTTDMFEFRDNPDKLIKCIPGIKIKQYDYPIFKRQSMCIEEAFKIIDEFLAQKSTNP